MEKENMSLDQLDSLKTSLEDKLEKLKEELLEVDTEIHWRTIKSKVTVFKEMFESRINQFCKFTRYVIGIPEVVLCRIDCMDFDTGKNSWVVQTELIATYNSHNNKVKFFSKELSFIYEEQFLSGRLDDIIFYESLDEVKMVLKSIVDEQVK